MVCVSRINESVVIVLNMERVGEEEVPAEDHPHLPIHLFTVFHMWGKRCIGLTSSLATVTHSLKYRHEEENVTFKRLP